MIKRLLNLSKAVLKCAPGVARLIRQRDDAIAELNQYLKEDEQRDRVPAKLHAAVIERDAYLEQRDQAYRELDDVIKERNRLKGEFERLRRELGK
jgi:hypothetical protein